MSSYCQSRRFDHALQNTHDLSDTYYLISSSSQNWSTTVHEALDTRRGKGGHHAQVLCNDRRSNELPARQAARYPTRFGRMKTQSIKSAIIACLFTFLLLGLTFKALSAGAELGQIEQTVANVPSVSMAESGLVSPPLHVPP